MAFVKILGWGSCARVDVLPEKMTPQQERVDPQDEKVRLAAQSVLERAQESHPGVKRKFNVKDKPKDETGEPATKVKERGSVEEAHETPTEEDASPAASAEAKPAEQEKPVTPPIQPRGPSFESIQEQFVEVIEEWHEKMMKRFASLKFIVHRKILERDVTSFKTAVEKAITKEDFIRELESGKKTIASRRAFVTGQERLSAFDEGLPLIDECLEALTQV